MQCKEVGPSQCSSRKMAPSSRGTKIKQVLTGLPFLCGVPPLQKEEMVKCPGASLDSASSGCHHLEWPSGLGLLRDRSQGYDQESSRVPGATQLTFNSEWRDSRPSCPVVSKQFIGGSRAAFLRCRHLEWLPVPGTVSPVCPLPLWLICGVRNVSVTLVWYSGVVSCCAEVRMSELLHDDGSASVKEILCTLCWKHQGFGVHKTVTLHALRGLNWPSTGMGDWNLASFFFPVEVRCVCVCF